MSELSYSLQNAIRQRVAFSFAPTEQFNGSS